MTPQEYLKERERINGRDPETSVARVAPGDKEPELRLDPNVLVFVRDGVSTITREDDEIQLMLEVVFVDAESNLPIIPEPILLPIGLFQLAQSYEDTTGGMG